MEKYLNKYVISNERGMIQFMKVKKIYPRIDGACLAGPGIIYDSTGIISRGSMTRIISKNKKVDIMTDEEAKIFINTTIKQLKSEFD